MSDLPVSERLRALHAELEENPVREAPRADYRRQYEAMRDLWALADRFEWLEGGESDIGPSVPRRALMRAYARLECLESVEGLEKDADYLDFEAEMSGAASGEGAR